MHIVTVLASVYSDGGSVVSSLYIRFLGVKKQIWEKQLPPSPPPVAIRA